MGMPTFSSPPGVQFPSWRKFTVPYTTFQTAAVTLSPTIFTLPVKGVVHAAAMNVTQVFAGTTTLTISVGIVGTVAKFVIATSGLGTGLASGVALSVPDIESMSATTAVVATAVSSIENLSLLSQGSVDIYLLVSQLP